MGSASLTSLGDIADFVNGDRGKNYPSGSAFVADGIPFVSAADIANGGVDVSSAKRISREAFKRLGSGKTRKGDVLFCLRGSLGKTGRVEGLPEAAIASSLVIVRAKQRTDPRFLYYLLISHVIQGVTGALDNGSVQPNLSVREMAKISVPDLRLPEQRAIAHILGTLDDKIELNRRINETLETMARALFKSWFVDFDPVRAKAEGRDPGLPKPIADLFPEAFEDSALGEIPKGWSAIPIYDIATYSNGAAYAAFQPNAERRGLPIIKITEPSGRIRLAG